MVPMGMAQLYDKNGEIIYVSLRLYDNKYMLTDDKSGFGW